ncbi:MAG: hypothetical protein JXA73_09560 [Acidobacteria bacterium]|nr:hypothetical protein [Acidobacteriota bacterium]
MKMKRVKLMLVLAAICIFCIRGFGQAAQTCDRQCLVDLMKNYLAALVAHNPAAMPFDKYAKFTQNTAEIPIGYGLWETASSGPTEFQIYAADPVNQQVACLAMMKENTNQNILLGVRLALRRGKISEAEHHVVTQEHLHAMHNLVKPRPGLVEDIAPEDRTPRDRMLDIGLSYYDALTGEDGTLAPFAVECQRRENGGISVGGKDEAPAKKEAGRDFAPPSSVDPEMMKLAKALSAVPNTCEGQITAGVWGYISEIRNRRLLVIDEQKGLAVGFSNLYHDSRLKTMKLKGVPGVESVPAYQGTFNMPAIHIFKIKKGKIYDIEATGLVLPYGTKTGWE